MPCVLAGLDSELQRDPAGHSAGALASLKGLQRRTIPLSSPGGSRGVLSA